MSIVIGDDLESLSAPDARALTDRIKVGVEAVWELVTQAYVQRAWSALGYQSWDDYCTREFGTARLRLPREERADVVASLRESGLSIRAIASATGDSYSTIQRELSGDPNEPPEPECDGKCAPDECTYPVDEDTLAEELIAAEPPGAPTESTPGQTDRVADALALARQSEPTPIIGLDGKKYQPTSPKAPRRKPITEAFDSASYELRRAVERVANLIEDDRLEKNKDQIVGANLSDLIRVRDTLTGVIQHLEGTTHE